MERRTLLTRAIYAIGACFGAFLGIPIIAYLLDPRNRSAGRSDYQQVARFEELQPEVPKDVVVRNVRRDAWTLHPNDVIGRVWLVRRESGDAEQTVDAFTTICPHLGCSINFQAGSNRFLCPCHNGVFELSGDRIPESELGRPNPAPRGMDKLESRIVDGLVEVKYERFVQGLHTQKIRS